MCVCVVFNMSWMSALSLCEYLYAVRDDDVAQKRGL